jgi:hypothetical protein
MSVAVNIITAHSRDSLSEVSYGTLHVNWVSSLFNARTNLLHQTVGAVLLSACLLFLHFTCSLSCVWLPRLAKRL